MGLPNEYILSQNNKYNVQFGKSQKGTQRFPQLFSDSLGKCSKLKAKLKVKDGAQPVFKKKRNVPFAALELVNKELDSNKQVFCQKQTSANGQHLRSM